jgi:hypothetical protein
MKKKPFIAITAIAITLGACFCFAESGNFTEPTQITEPLKNLDDFQKQLSHLTKGKTYYYQYTGNGSVSPINNDKSITLSTNNGSLLLVERDENSAVKTVSWKWKSLVQPQLITGDKLPSSVESAAQLWLVIKEGEKHYALLYILNDQKKPLIPFTRFPEDLAKEFGPLETRYYLVNEEKTTRTLAQDFKEAFSIDRETHITLVTHAFQSNSQYSHSNSKALVWPLTMN